MIAGMSDLPFGFFGQSMGAHLAMALTHRLRSDGRPLPCHVFLSARRAPHLAPNAPLMAEMPDAELAATVERRFGDASVITDQGLSRLMLPTLRADIAATENWQTLPDPPLAMPVTAMGGIDDLWTAPSGLEAWRAYTLGRFQLRLFPGGHFFINSSRAAVITFLRAQLLSTIPVVDNETR
jgi:medium-chain acyl-[acyl-carrier-protein] hydrolase